MTTTPSTDETTKAKYEVALKGDTKTPMLLNEGGVKEVISALAKKGVIKGAEDINPELFAHYPNSITGVCMHLMVTGLKAELDIAFDETPKSIRQRGNNAMDKTKIATGTIKKRFLTREQKNELLEQAQMSYETKIATMEKMKANIKHTKKDIVKEDGKEEDTDLQKIVAFNIIMEILAEIKEENEG